MISGFKTLFSPADKKVDFFGEQARVMKKTNCNKFNWF